MTKGTLVLVTLPEAYGGLEAPMLVTEVTNDKGKLYVDGWGFGRGSLPHLEHFLVSDAPGPGLATEMRELPAILPEPTVAQKAIAQAAGPDPKAQEDLAAKIAAAVAIALKG